MVPSFSLGACVPVHVFAYFVGTPKSRTTQSNISMLRVAFTFPLCTRQNEAEMNENESAVVNSAKAKKIHRHAFLKADNGRKGVGALRRVIKVVRCQCCMYACMCACIKCRRMHSMVHI